MLLLVEDYSGYDELFKISLEEAGINIEVLSAKTIEEADRLFNQYAKNIEIIIMDACVPGKTPNTMNLIKEILKSGFTGPIVASSSNEEYNEVLVSAGATHSAEKDKAIKFTINLLKEMGEI